MVKAKAKAERAAARQASHATLVAAMLIAPAPAEASSSAAPAANDDAASTETAVAEPEEGSAPATPDRFELLRSKPEVVGRFMDLMVPILIDVYAASVITPVRVKTLTGLLKAVSFLDADGLKRVLTVGFTIFMICLGILILIFAQFVPVASFASSILSSKDHPTLVIGALQLVDLLLAKVPVLYKPTFRREGVFHEIELLSGRNIVSAPKPTKDKEGKEKEKEKEASESPAPPDHADLPPPPAAAVASGTAPTIPGFKKLSSLSLEPEDAITLRARVIQFKFLSGDDKSAGDGSFGVLQRLVEHIGRDGSEKDAVEALHEMAELFGAPHSSVSSFELLQSGVVDGLLQFATDAERKCE